MAMRKSSGLTINNDQVEKITVILEPWASEFQLKPKTSVEFKISYIQDGYPYVSISDQYIIVYLWKTCTSLVELDGVQLKMPELLVPHP
jgi:hypothetical protein